jgi:beta-galactosidase
MRKSIIQGISSRRRSLLLGMLMLPAVLVQAQTRQVENLNWGWRFQAGDVPGAGQPLFDDTRWREVDLPHDFQIEQPWVAPASDEKADNTDVAANIKSRLSSRGFKEMGQGWYRYHLTPDALLKDKRVVLDFGGIMYVGDVYLNGERIGGTDYGYVGFEVDLTGRLRWGEDNVIAVRADTREPQNSRWYTGGGLFRGVKLITTSADQFFTRHPLYITTRENRYVNISAEFTNRGRDRQSSLRVRILDPDGQQVYEGTATRRRNTQSRTMEAQMPEIEIPSPQLWDIDSPRLYTVVAQLLREDGTVADEVSERFGIRTVEIGPDYGLRLNGRKVLLQGYANHHTLGALGAANYPRAIKKRLELMKQFGINHIRTSHNPYSREFIELCDECGILVVDELYDKWTRQHTGGRVPFEQLWQYDVPEWVKRDRNSPSVVMWSLGNELQQDPNMPFNDFGVTMYKLQKALLQRYDSTRLVTVAMHPRYRNWDTDSLPCDLAMQTDVQAYNYRYMYFPGDGRRFPWMTFYQSEAAVAAMGPNFFEMDLDKVIGLAYWGAIDYLGESQGWPAKGWAQGVFDIALEPKPKAYLMKSMFKPDEPVVHIAVVDSRGDQMWNGVQTGNDGLSDHWDRKPGTHLQLITYTNADEVELVVNGKSLGRKANPTGDAKRRNQIRWDDVEYQPGKAVAIAYKGGREVARHQVETPGKAVKLVAVPDQDGWQADGLDLQHVPIYAVDSKGRRVYSAQHELQFATEGDARIVAVSNGNIRSDELYCTNHIHLYNGSAMAILRAGRQAGSVVLTTRAEGLKPLKTKLTCK